MALLVIKGSDGRSHLVHSSIFDSHRPAMLLGAWSDVWSRFDASGSSQAHSSNSSSQHGSQMSMPES